MRRLLFANLLVALGLSMVAAPPPTTNASTAFLLSESDSERLGQSLTVSAPVVGSTIYLPIVRRERDLIVGVMGIPDDQLGLAVAWGGNTIEYHKTLYGTELQSHFDTIKGLGGRLILRAIGNFQNTDGTLNIAAVLAALDGTFAGTTVIGDPAFAGFYIIDEVCHPTKWPNLTGAALVALYQDVKAYDARVPVMHNFDDMACVETRLTETGNAPIADIAGVTITYANTNNDSNITGFMADQAATAAAVKATSPSLKLLPTVAIFDSNEQSLPSQTWVETVGLIVLAEPNYDGLMYYPWTTPYWANTSLEDHSEYWDEIQRVFATD